MDKFVVIDLETTGHDPVKEDKIIEVGMVVIKNNEIVDKRSTLINPEQHIPPFITNLTNITDADVEDAPFFHEKADSIIDIFKDSYLIAHNVPFDLGFLNTELENIGRSSLKNPVLDTVELSRILYPKAPSYKLTQLAQYLNIEHTDPHRAVSDAYVTAKIFLNLMDKLKGLPYETLTQLLQIENGLKSDLGVILTRLKEEASFELIEEESDLHTFQGLAFKIKSKLNVEREPIELSFGTYLDDIYEKEGKLEYHLKQYEKRPGQREMSEIIFDAFKSKKHGLIEAETGTGKSLAYLLPAIYEAVVNNKRLVISTHTTQLQTQLLEEEIPLMKQLIPFAFEAVLLKGQSHYLSLERFSKELENDDSNNYDITLTKAILLIWITETFTGDIDEIQLPSVGYAFFSRISAAAEGGLDPYSPWFSYSYYAQAKKHAQKANLLITNHALLCTDMFNDYRFLPAYQNLIIDEAHHLEDTAAHHYGLKLDNITMNFTLNQIGRSEEHKIIGTLMSKYREMKQYLSLEKWDQAIDSAKREIEELFDYLNHYVRKQRRKKKGISDIGHIQYRFDVEEEDPASIDTITEMSKRLTFYLRDLIQYLTHLDSLLEEAHFYDKHDKQEIHLMVEKLQEFIHQLELLFLTEKTVTHVEWLEMESKGTNQKVYLYSEPTGVASLLKNDLFMKKNSVILTSATLTMNNSFNFIIERLGLPEENLITSRIESPFSYQDQIQFLVPNDFPDIKFGKEEEFIYATCEAILSLAEITDGRMLVLFTSYDMLKKSYQLLREIMDGKSYMLIGQGITSGSRSRLKKNFQNFERAILLGTSSFWEGVDIPGEALSGLMIVRLPFQPPNHPVFEAKSQELKEKGKNPFMELSLPNAVIRFKQGFGRLIRSKSDRGLVFICDARIIQARYGKYFTNSIPEVPITYESTQKIMKKAKDWF